ncbi:thiamine-phosphate kinase [Ponticaulis sp.]|uniref:thiamine-phosphate kinase n=1 Tax=Ponticaulis sp. TaxID=2020902 RepID=UPI000B678E29|nr:thiamine-phosphate kinase [Ponticaulis sp.]MAI92064.1 thiamine-phosphate kinase [Ponticaulis sp.]OUX96240.1 MAG: thiamine-phosphate kinase [Hyphomonadaceae bacterium TMED5]
MREFDLIKQRLALLSGYSGAEGLSDDVSLVPVSSAQQIITTDTLAEGVHFFSDDPLFTVGQKLVRVNVSDCLAKGALPKFALFNLTWPRSRTDAELSQLIDGLGTDFHSFKIDLIGGDTTASEREIVLSLTLIGEAANARIVRRSSAKVDEDVWVTGLIGCGALGLAARRELGPAQEDHRVAPYLVPELPRLSTASLIGEYASASADVSDGLLADLGHIADASGAGIECHLSDIPLVENAEFGLLELDLLTGGDDYQTVFTAPVSAREAIERDARTYGQAVSRIGRVTVGQGVRLIGSDGMPIKVLKSGWQHQTSS